MAESAKQEQHIYRLSLLDQSVTRAYITTALCFPCDNELVKLAVDRFTAAIMKMITGIPLLAGAVRQSTDGDGAVRGYLEVAASYDEVISFTPTVHTFEDPNGEYAYEALRAKRFPAGKLEIMQLAPLTQKPDSTGAKAFAAQLNIIPGGLIAVFQLHHSIADIVGMRTILEFCSMDRVPCELDPQGLKEQAVMFSKGRQLLSDAGGVTPAPSTASAPPPTLVLGETEGLEKVTCVLGFNLKLIDETTAMVNDRFFGPDGQPRQLPVDALQVLAAILWRGVIRARKAASLIYLTPTNDLYAPHPASRIIFPVDIRERMQPNLRPKFFGNAIANGVNGQSIASLEMPIDISSLKQTVLLIRGAKDLVTERTVRLAIAKAKESDYTNNPTTTAANSLTDVVITDWSDLLPNDASLCLGLGEPTFVRKLSGEDADEGCNIHARPTEGGIWEVTMTLSEPAMEKFLGDEGVMKFVDYADGERYVNGRTAELDAGQQILIEDEYERSQQRTAWRNRHGLPGAGMMGGGAGMMGGGFGQPE